MSTKNEDGGQPEMNNNNNNNNKDNETNKPVPSYGSYNPLYPPNFPMPSTIDSTMIKQPWYTPAKVMESCPARAAFSGVAGGGLGVLFGLVFGNYDIPHDLSFKEQMRMQGRLARVNAVSYAKSFATVGFIYAGIECGIDKYRGTHDLYTSASTGCISGAILGARLGPSAAATGCAGFAAFSVAFDWFLRH